MFDFDLGNVIVLLRIVCGFFFIPHAIAKFQNPAPAADFFRAAGYSNPLLCAKLGRIFETVVGLALIFGVYTKIAAWLSAIFLLVAAASVWKVNRKWMWQIGGFEFTLFWALCCIILALHT